MPDSSESSHPGAAQFAAFALGKLAGAERTALQAHLAQCPACHKAVAALPGGTESLSERDTLAPAGVVQVAAAPAPDATTAFRPEVAVPADLVNHPRYEVLQLLGQGGMGAVYKARHKKMDRLVALKIINAKLLDNPKTVERFHREVQAAAKLDHPNIVRAFDADEAGGTHFLVMEFVEGTDLAKYVEKKGPLPVTHACHFIRQAALGLQHAHEKGMVHRDIKPHNLMLTITSRDREGAVGPALPDGRGSSAVVKVMDFGLARLALLEGASEAGLTGDNVLMGTADYIAPEQATDAHKADIRADIYSLGCALFHLLAGKPPFGGGTVVQKIAAHLTRAIPLAELPATVPADLRAMLAKMVEKDPAQRYQAPGEVAQALALFVKKATGAKPPPVPNESRPSGSGGKVQPLVDARGSSRKGAKVADEPVAPVKRARKRKRERRWPVSVWIGAGVLAFLVLIGSVVVVVNRGRQPAVEPLPGPINGDAAKQPEALPANYTNSLGMEFVLVPKGKFLMGGGGGTVGDKEVEIAHDFYLGTYEVTQGEWGAMMGNPSQFSRAHPERKEIADFAIEDLKRFPVETVSWEDAQEFLTRVNDRDKKAGWLYRLPKEAEWEYACRGGELANKRDYGFDYYFEKPTNLLLPEQANFAHAKGLKRPCKVGSYKPNRLGLYDMHGNIQEWCDDTEKAADGASRRVCRGGACARHQSGNCRAAVRNSPQPSLRDDFLGLRLARVPVGKEPIAPKSPEVKKSEKPAPKFTNSLGMEFVLVGKGTAWLGGGNGLPGEKKVEIAEDFYLGKYEVTQEEWERVAGVTPSHFFRAGPGKDAVKDIPDADQKRFPVEQVSWDHAQLFLERLNRREKEAGWIYRLPKEAEWEYACRGGPTSNKFDYSFDYYFEKPSNLLLPEQANLAHEKGLKRTCMVGSYKPNRLGLYDMHGNLWEWCDDSEKAADGGSRRVSRGGSWLNDSRGCRAAARRADPPSDRGYDIGLRLARVPVGKY